MHVLEHQAELVTKDIHGVSEGEELSGGLLDTLMAVMAIVQQLLEVCPNSSEKVVEAVKNPGPGQKVALFIITQRTARAMNLPPSRVDDLYQYILARSKMLSDDEVKALVEETSDVSNLLI